MTKVSTVQNTNYRHVGIIFLCILIDMHILKGFQMKVTGPEEVGMKKFWKNTALGNVILNDLCIKIY